MELFDVIRASLVAVFLLLALVLACLLVAGLVLLASGAFAAGSVMVTCYAYPDGRGCARSTTSFLAVPTLLFAQTLIGLGSLLSKLLFMLWSKRVGVLIAVFGSSLPVYGCYRPVEAVSPSAAAHR